jgi:PAS domain S-box-containing protein
MGSLADFITAQRWCVYCRNEKDYIVSTLLEFLWQLSNTAARPKTARKIAESLGAETLLIFIRDDELNILLPAPGFIQTIKSLQSWQTFLDNCIKSRSNTGTLYFPDEFTQKSATAVAYKDELVFLLLGGQPDKQKMQEIHNLLPLLASVLKNEQIKSWTEARLKVAEKSLAANSDIVNKLNAVRQELQLAFSNMQKETEARQITEKALANQQQILNDLFTQVPAVFAVLQGPKHVFELANPLYRKLVGGRDVVGKPVREALPELKGQGIYKLLDEVYKSGTPFIGNEALVKLDRQGNGKTEDGYYNFVYQPSLNGKGKVTGILVHGVDVTEQVLARKKVQASEERLRFMAESMPQKVFTATPNGDTEYLNPQWATYTGLDLNNISNWGWTQFIHPEDIDATIASWEQSLKCGEPFQIENRFRRHDGVYRHHLNRAQALRDKNGKILMWIGSSTDIEDITQTVARKEELELIAAGLKEQRKQLVAINNAKDEFIALASHQLRTPATAVKQYISLVLSGYASPVTSIQKKYLKTAYDSNERQLNIINDLLKTAQIDSNGYQLKKNHHYILSLIKEIIAELQPIFNLKSQKVIVENKDKIGTILIDGNEMKLVLSNLIENASKYSHKGSVVKVSLQKKNQNLLIKISDTGVGIANGDTRRIFDKFTRIDNELSDTVAGTGLGLYWVKQIIMLHGGTVKVSSKLGKGSSFVINLPL